MLLSVLVYPELAKSVKRNGRRNQSLGGISSPIVANRTALAHGAKASPWSARYLRRRYSSSGLTLRLKDFVLFLLGALAGRPGGRPPPGLSSSVGGGVGFDQEAGVSNSHFFAGEEEVFCSRGSGAGSCFLGSCSSAVFLLLRTAMRLRALILAMSYFVGTLFSFQ